MFVHNDLMKTCKDFPYCNDRVYSNYNSVVEVPEQDVHCQLSIFDFGAFYE